MPCVRHLPPQYPPTKTPREAQIQPSPHDWQKKAQTLEIAIRPTRQRLFGSRDKRFSLKIHLVLKLSSQMQRTENCDHYCC
jgi:hypothetical protein